KRIFRRPSNGLQLELRIFYRLRRTGITNCAPDPLSHRQARARPVAEFRPLPDPEGEPEGAYSCHEYNLTFMVIGIVCGELSAPSATPFTWLLPSFLKR